MKRDFTQYKSAWWEINYPSAWTVGKHSECTSFYAEDGVGALQISSYSTDSEITKEDLDELVSDEVPENTNVKSVEVGNLKGFAAEFKYKNHFWRMWFLVKGKLLLYVTYNCEFEDAEVERETIDQILCGLKCLN